MKTEQLLEALKNINISSDSAEIIADKYIQFLYFEQALTFCGLIVFFCLVYFLAKLLINSVKE
jgi:hypothetical protein